MLEEAFDKLRHRKPNPFDLLGPVVPITKGHLAGLETFQARMGDGDAEDIPAQIIEHLVAPTGVLGMHDPGLLPSPG